MRCTTKFEYTLAPLLVTCGERSAGTQVLGWLLWALTIGSLLTAGALAIAALVETQTRVRRRFAIFESWVLTIGAATVLLLTSGILAADQERLGGTNAWIIYASGGSTLLLILISIVHPIIWLAVKQNSGVER